MNMSINVANAHDQHKDMAFRKEPFSKSSKDSLIPEIATADSYAGRTAAKVAADLDNLIATLETYDMKSNYQPVPEDLSQAVNNLCTKYAVGDPIWTESPTEPMSICIRGRGVEKIGEELESRFPSYTFTLVESGPMHTKQLCGGSKEIAVQRFGVDDDDRRWEDVASVPFQLLVEGTEMNRQSQNRALYAVTTAHSIVGEQECEQMAEEMKSIVEVRRQTREQEDEVQHVLQISELGRHDLGLPTMVAHRHYYANINTSTDDPNWRCCAGKCRTPEGCPHMHMNDIAVLRVDKIPKSFPITQNCRAVKFDGFANFNMQHISKMITERKIVYINVVNGADEVHEMQGRLVRGFRTAGDQPTRTLANHVTFLITEGYEQEGGFPLVGGTILYVKQYEGPQARRFAFAMIVGGIFYHEWHYQAVMLMPALRDIEMDYPQYVGNISNSSRPPCGYLTAN